MAPDEGGLIEEARHVWSAVAAGWERNADLVARTSAPVQGWLVGHLDPRAGQTILELGAGPGDTGFEIAGRLGPDGLLISSDISPRMSDVARRRAERLGVTNADFRVIDAQDIGLDANSVDGVVHRFGPMLLPDPATSVAEVRRVLRDGGSYVAAVWAGPDQNPWVLAMGLSLISNGIEISGGDPTGPGGIFSLGDRETFRSLVAGRGFDEVEVEVIDLPFDYESLDELWVQPSELAGGLSEVIAGLPASALTAVKKSFQEFVEPYRSGTAYHLPAQAICLSAR